ncbi:MAG: IclR family transcriptional regulator C-terminal domain-containing protein [Pseudomonadota bacterium]|nr:IclR family transcriptional regulator C-terminal domain-containing protein [Pseudomonadota bacterium]
MSPSEIGGVPVTPPLSDRDISSTFAKGLTVLRAFDDTHSRLTLAEIAHFTGLDRASVRRLTLTLVHLGYAQKDGRHFSLTPKVLILAGSFLRGNQFGTHVQPLLNRYAKVIGAGVSLAIPDENSAVYIANSIGSDGDISFGFTIGSRLPLLHTAVGRMLLAMGNPEWSKAAIETAPVEQYTTETITDREALAKSVAEARAKGYAIVSGEFEAGVLGFAVPVGGLHRTQAALGTSLPTLSLPREKERLQIIGELHKAAAELSRFPLFT